MEATPLYEAYAAVAPRPEDWPQLVTKTGQLTTSDYDWTAGVETVTAPTLLIYGDADSVLPRHTIELFELLGGAVVGDMGEVSTTQLAVLPNTAHSAVLMQVEPILAILIPFLDAPMPDAS
jgi:pimeloyl-ACP methyl ester carboxylesterase